MRSPLHRPKGNDPLDQAFDQLGAMLSPRLARTLRWIHHPNSGYVRVPLGIVCVIASFFSFLPVLGIELLPIGLMFIGQDVPFLRKPVGRMMLRLLEGARRLKRWWRARLVSLHVRSP